MSNGEALCPPDVSSNPYRFTVEHMMDAAPAVLYRLWTEQFDRWFATPGTLLMKPEINVPFFWEVQHEGNRYPHYGRFLKLEPNRLVEMTWLTGPTGTKGAETVVTVELEPVGSRTRLRLTQAGFCDQESRDGHEQAWRAILAHLNEQLQTPF